MQSILTVIFTRKKKRVFRTPANSFMFFISLWKNNKIMPAITMPSWPTQKDTEEYLLPKYVDSCLAPSIDILETGNCVSLSAIGGSN